MVYVSKEKRTGMDALRHARLDRPNGAGGHWAGIPHHQLILAVRVEAQKRGWVTEDWRIVLSPNQANMTACCLVTLPDLNPPDGLVYSLGVTASNDGTCPNRFWVGAVALCSGTAVVVDSIALGRVHTVNAAVDEVVTYSLSNWLTAVDGIGHKVNTLKQRRLTKKEVDSALMEAGRDGCLPWSRVGRVDQEYQHPTFAQYRPRTAWSLLHCFSLVVQMNPPLEQLGQLLKFYHLLPK